MDIFQPDKIHEFVKMREITFEDKKDKEIDEMESEWKEKLQKSSDSVELLLDEYISAASPPYSTKRISLRKPEGLTRIF